jgi:hypothetical protein
MQKEKQPTQIRGTGLQNFVPNFRAGQKMDHCFFLSASLFSSGQFVIGWIRRRYTLKSRPSVFQLFLVSSFWFLVVSYVCDFLGAVPLFNRKDRQERKGDARDDSCCFPGFQS